SGSGPDGPHDRAPARGDPHRRQGRAARGQCAAGAADTTREGRVSTMRTAAAERRGDTIRWLLGSARGLLTPLLSAAAARIVSQLLGVALLVLTAGALARAATDGGAGGGRIG